jgi:hypothetical protein
MGSNTSDDATQMATLLQLIQRVLNMFKKFQLFPKMSAYFTKCCNFINILETALAHTTV